MTIEARWQAQDDIALFAVGTALLRNRWRVVRWAFFGAVLALAFVFNRPALYRATASFIPQGSDPGRSGIASLAGQFGVSLPSSGQTLTPDFYVRLLKSRELLGRVARDTFTVPEMGNRRVPFSELAGIEAGNARLREEIGVQKLSKSVSASASALTGVIELEVATRWPSVSLAIATELVQGANDFNERTRRDQAAAERKFVEGRLAVASAELRVAEDRLEQFLQGNRQFGSPELSFARDRLQRNVLLKQQVFSSLTQSYEDVRMREVRDTPVITLVDSPSVPTMPESRGRALAVLIGLIVGAAVGAALVIIRDIMDRRRAVGDTTADEFVAAVQEMRGALMRPIRSLRRRSS